MMWFVAHTVDQIKFHMLLLAFIYLIHHHLKYVEIICIRSQQHIHSSLWRDDSVLYG